MSGRSCRWERGAVLVVAALVMGTGLGLAPTTATAAPAAGAATNAGSALGPVGSVETKGIGLLGPNGPAWGPDGNLWFASTGSDSIVRMRPDGAVTNFTDPGMNEPWDVAAGPDGNLWFTIGLSHQIGRITPTGVITRFSSPAISYPRGISAGPDGNLWFTDFAKDTIGRITPAGVITTFAGAPNAIESPDVIVAGPDGAMWFLGVQPHGVGRITTAGDVTVVETGIFAPDDITVGPDGNLWIASSNADTIARITTAGVVTPFTGPEIRGPVGITTGPDGNLWFTSSQYLGGDGVGRITPTGTVINTFAGPDLNEPQDITTGPDGNLWVGSFFGSSVTRLSTEGATTRFVGDRIAAAVSIARGHDGNMWFANFWTGSIGRVTPTGEFTDFPVPAFGDPSTVAAGPDGNVWFTSWRGDYIGKITPAGQMSIFRDPFIKSARDLAAGPDGEVWFVNGNHHGVGRISSAGQVTSVLPDADPDSLVTGADGNVWISLTAGLGRVTPGGVLTILGETEFRGARSLVLGRDGNVWFGTDDYGVGFMTPAGAVTLVPTGALSLDLAVGPDGNIWSTTGTGERIDRITPTGQVDSFTDPAMDQPTAIAAGFGGELWFTDFGNGSIATIRAVEGEPPGPGAAFHAVVPQRILDSRLPTVGFAGPVAAGSPRSLQVTGLAGPSSVPWGASAVVMNVTTTGSTESSFVTVSPTGGAPTNASNLNFAAGEVRANLVTVKIGAGGKVDIANAVGTTHVVADVVGYYDDGFGPGGLFNPVAPVRLLDSRTSTGGWSGPLTSASPRQLVVQRPGSVLGVPPTATAVVANVTATRADTSTFVTAWPAGVPQPTTSNLNLVPGQNVANLVTIGIGSGGAISFATAAGSVDLVVDLVGYFDPTDGLRFHAIDPTRVLDSRTGQGLAGAQGPGMSRNVTVAAGGRIPAGASALVTNLTVVEPTAESFVSVYPGNVGRPDPYSNVNVVPGQVVANLSAVGLAPDGSIGVYNHLGSTHLVADAVGYYTAAG